MTREKKILAAVLEAALLMDKHNLEGWKIKLNKRQAALALTNYLTKTIEFSERFLIVADKEQLRGVTLHEITHAILGPFVGHGPKFKEKCTELTGSTEYSSAHVKGINIRKYIVSCPVCGTSGGLSRRVKRYCKPCFDLGETVEMQLKDNKLKVKSW